MMNSTQGVPEQIKTLLIALKERDDNTAAHSNRTGVLSVKIGESCCLQSRELAILRIAAVIHDLGKIGIPDRVLLKPGRLDDEEWQVMKTHPRRAYNILMATQVEGADVLADLVLHHHESFDGHGYPSGLAGEAIPVMSRIIAIADSYDAMATCRAYHRSRSHQAIMDIMYGEDGHKYDPYLRNKFAENIANSLFKSEIA